MSNFEECFNTHTIRVTIGDNNSNYGCLGLMAWWRTFDGGSMRMMSCTCCADKHTIIILSQAAECGLVTVLAKLGHRCT